VVAALISAVILPGGPNPTGRRLAAGAQASGPAVGQFVETAGTAA
jgi:hypothetical protein